MRAPHKLLVASLLLLASLILAIGQAGRRPNPTNEGSLSLNVVAVRENDSKGPITSKQISLYDGGIEQTVKSFSLDPSPARIVLLVDNSLTIRADVEKLEAAAREFAYEIYEGDKLLIVGYDEQAEIVADWTDDAKQIEKSLASFRKKGEPHLFDALSAVSQEALLQLKATNQKRIIVVISDGLDRGSKTKFDRILAELQSQDITVYAVQAPDRTGGALRRDQPKPVQVIEKLVEGTGGRIFPINAPQEAAKAICDELRKSRYILSYAPTNVAFGDARRLLIMADSGINVRAKTLQPPN
ncbi:MAG TPA: VWA domain-containing protein [Pyrinomonadaceae bacterium]|nr:VWA domain-containing protein [Pyrinomonadaceae bacterium]